MPCKYKSLLANTRVLFSQTGEVLESYYPFGMSLGSELTFNNTDDSPENKYKYNGKELQDEFGLGWYDYGVRFYDGALGRFTVADNLAEKYYSESSYIYVSNNPIFFIDPDGQDKVKAQAHLKVTTGIIGAGIKALGFKYSFSTAKEWEISFNISFDTDSKELTIGAAALVRKKGDDELIMGGVYGGGKTSEKEKGIEVKTGYSFSKDEFVAEKDPIDDGSMKEVNEATIGVGTGSEKEDEGVKLSIGVNPEVNAGAIGCGIGVNLSIQRDEEKTKKSKQE